MLIRVWAPFAEDVRLIAGSTRSRMDRSRGGWWEGDLGASIDYAFSIDGSDPIPDPRSSWQPHGSKGPSRVDPQEHVWNDGGWSPPPFEDWVIYELHVGTFTEEGTFSAVEGKLDHLVDLGVNAVELMPVNTFPGDRGWGYDGVGLFAPHHAYGSPDDLRHLVDACHARGLATVLDVVYNHLGPADNHLARFGPFFTDRYNTPWGDAVNFDDWGSDEVRSFFIDNALHWLDRYHFDGLRLDAVHAIFDRSATHFLEELSNEVNAYVERSGRLTYLIAESDLNDPRIVRPSDAGGYGIDAQWSDDFHHALHALLTGERTGYYQDFGATEQLAKALQDAFVYDGNYSRYRGRRHGRSPAGLPSAAFLAYMQNHDQVGNRARGDRIDVVAGRDLQKIGAALVLFSPFVPLLFMGEEWAATSPFRYFTDHRDPELGAAVSAGRKREFRAFGWDPDDVPDPQDLATFEASKLDWSEVSATSHSEMLDWYRELLRLRHERPELTPGGAPTEVRYDEGWIVVERGALVLACNLSDSDTIVPDVEGKVVLASKPVDTPDGKLSLPPQSVAIVT